jgi:biotin carboxylase
MKEIIIVAHIATDSVNEGFLPAAKSLNLHVVLLTDCAPQHREHFSQANLAGYPDEIVACDVFNPLAIIDAITRCPRRPAAIFSNSDHLQTSTALAACYFGLPAKDWRATYRAKNKAEMRTYLAALGIDTLWHAVVCDAPSLASLDGRVPFPCVVKPREGVASQQVSLSRDTEELQTQCAAIWATHPGQPLLLEEYIEGPLYTLETLSDGKQLVALGGFRTLLSPPPHFVEMEAIWGTGLPAQTQAQVLDTIRHFGIGFGACHTEYVMTDGGPRLIEINYRTIGDYREFLLRDTLQIPLFELVLRLYLGEQLLRLDVAPNVAWIRYFTAPSAGKLTQAPSAFSHHDGDIRLSYKPLRRVGESIQLTNSNKDYVGVLRGTGTSAERLGAIIESTSGGLSWEIAP